MNNQRPYDIRQTEPSSCLECRRRLQKIDRRYDQPEMEAHGFCGFCGKALTEAARAKRQPAGVATKASVLG